MQNRKQLIFKVVTVLAAVAIVVCALWIMARHLGLDERFDFGAGAYYYNDHPQLQEEVDKAKAAYHTSVPVWVHIVLFLAWGALMYWLWKRIDRRK